MSLLVEKKKLQIAGSKRPEGKVLPELDLQILVVSVCSETAAAVAGRNGCGVPP